MVPTFSFKTSSSPEILKFSFTDSCTVLFPETASENLGTGGETEDRLPAKTAGKGNAGSEETTEPHILSLLKKFPAYPSLYIDTHGGTYAPDTAAAIRGKAVLYRNPFYNELKKKS